MWMLSYICALSDVHCMVYACVCIMVLCLCDVSWSVEFHICSVISLVHITPFFS